MHSCNPWQFYTFILILIKVVHGMLNCKPDHKHGMCSRAATAAEHADTGNDVIQKLSFSPSGYNVSKNSGCKWVGSTRERPETRRVGGRVRAASDPKKPKPTRPGKTQPLIGFGVQELITERDQWELEFDRGPGESTEGELSAEFFISKRLNRRRCQKFLVGKRRGEKSPSLLQLCLVSGPQQIQINKACAAKKPGSSRARPKPEHPIVGFGFGQTFVRSDPTRPNPTQPGMYLGLGLGTVFRPEPNPFTP
ncbi:hypothetical protein PSTG_07438 [Puccinia striiformis f. sp. tritici PST-78]|uniref:Uncharacterized protein n=1 Tax=Puccinia striiformis f. sp. tritici PST-78 TaxID=1165861 RepID=A0A0L0VJC9_9BASI|nr:hypothetical protein PSTG_07438 [Puccinia striiformis f. sp. tritici PST-78]